MAAAGENMRRRRGRRGEPTSSGMAAAGGEEEDDDAMLLYDGDKTKQRSTQQRAAQLQDESLMWTAISHYVQQSCRNLKSRITRWLQERREAAAAAAGGADGEGEGMDPVAQACVDIIATQASVAFIPDRLEHEEQLREVWSALKPGVPYERHTRAWGDIGFQGKDPVTDLRGTGALGLRNLLYFVRNHLGDAQQILSDPRAALPLAIAVINITSSLLAMLKASPRVGNEIFAEVESGELALHLYDQLFALVFLEFVSFHTDAVSHFLAKGGNPALAIMEFNGVSRSFFEVLGRQMRSGKFEESFLDKCAHTEPEVPFLESVVQHAQGQGAPGQVGGPTSPGTASLIDLS